MKKFGKLAAALMGGCSAIVLAPVAAQAQNADSGDIVVTGSRVIQNGNNSPTPLTVVTTEQLTATTTSTIPDALNKLPVFLGSPGQGTNPGNSSRNNNANRLNLRAIGQLRTLILFDGRRLPPADPLGEIIVDIVPTMLLQRVDVVTGGVSAVYGSDGVAGVVNFITDKNFNGIKANFSAGIAEAGDAQRQRVGVAGGRDVFDGRGHIEGSYEFYNDAGIFDENKRNWDKAVWTMQGNGTTIPFRLVKNTRLSSTSFLGYITTAAGNTGNPLRDTVFRENGIASPFQHGEVICATPGSTTAPCVAGVESGGDGAWYYQSSSRALSTSHMWFGRFDYDLTSNINAYVEYTGHQSRTMNNHQTNEVNRGTVLSATNGFLPIQYSNQMLAAGKTTFVFTKMLRQMGPLQPETHMNGYLIQSGLDGSIGDYKWDLSYVHGSYGQHTRNNFNMDQQRLIAAEDAVDEGLERTGVRNGNIVCRVTVTNPGLYPGCTPLNLFGPTSESQASIDYITALTQFDTAWVQDDIGASFSGSPFSTWAGPVEMALSGEWRRTTYDLVSNAQPNAANCTGLRFNCTASTLKYISNVVADNHGNSQSVSEGAFETNVPLLRDAPLVKELNVSGAVRYTYYDTSGYATTWKAGLDWHVTDDLTVRATRSRDIRAPNINNLFASALVNPAGVTDLHTGIVGQAPFVTNSNPDLKPEVGNTTTAGIVYRPSFLPGASLAVDYYQINITDAIQTVQGQNNTVQAICEASGGTSEFCKLIERPLPFSDKTAANFVSAFYSSPQNVAAEKYHGLDIEGNYSTEIFGGKLGLRYLASFQPQATTVNTLLVTRQNGAGTATTPKWRHTLFADYALGKYTVNVQERWYQGGRWNADDTLVFTPATIKGNNYTYLTVSREIADRSTAYISIDNIFNQQPQPYGNIGGSSGVPGLFGGFVPGVDDQMGRYYTVGVRLRY